MNLLHRLITLCLVMTMVLTSGAMASMRSSEDGEQRLVICTGVGPEVILLGANGEPVERAPICPDCTMVLEAGPLPLLALELSLPKRMAAPAWRSAHRKTGPAGLGSQPRAPPALAG